MVTVWTFAETITTDGASCMYSQDPLRCLFCETPADQHHYDPKGMGGTRDVAQLEDTVPLCRQCHMLIHDQGYQLVRTTGEGDHGTDTLYQMVNPDGEIVAERHFLNTFDQSEFIYQLQGHGKFLVERAPSVLFLDHEGLKAAAAEILTLGKQGWGWQAYLLQAAVSRSVHGTRGEKVAAACDAFGFSRSTAYELLATVENTPDLSSRLETTNLNKTQWMLTGTGKTPEEAAGIREFLEAKRDEDPRYSVRQARLDLGKPHALCHHWDEEEQRCMTNGER